VITTDQVAHTNHWLRFFQDVWEAGAPVRLHTRELDDAGNPNMHPEFLHWLDGTSGRHEGTEDRARLKRAMKRVRERSLREYEVLYRVMVLGHSIPEVADWLSLRAAKAGFADEYTSHDTLVILYAAVDKLLEWY